MLDEEISKKMGKSAFYIFLGNLIGAFLNYAAKALIARAYSPSAYGLISLGLALFTLITYISIMGCMESIPRWMSHFSDKKRKIKGIMIAGFKLVLPISILASISLYFLSGNIAGLMNEKALEPILRAFSLGIVSFSTLNIFIASIRGLKNSKYKILSYDVTWPGLRVLFVSIIIFMGLSLTEIAFAHILALSITAIVAFFFLRKIFPLLEVKSSGFSFKKLFLFSWPLMISTLLFRALRWTELFMVGFFKTAQSVGLYNVALPTASMLIFVLTSFNYLFLPMSSDLHSKDSKEKIKNLYSSVTRWIFLITFPGFLLMSLYSSKILEIFFGANYTSAGIVLSILAIGYFYTAFVGPTGSVLISVGRTKSFMAIYLIITAANLLLNVPLIPLYGILGASVALTVSLILGWTFSLILVHKELNINPFTRKLLKPFSISVLLIIPFLFSVLYLNLSIIQVFIEGILFLFLYLLSLNHFDALEPEDKAIIKIFLNKVRGKLWKNSR